MIKQFLWILPFIIFLSSYFITSRLFHINSIQTPALMGKTVQEAFKILSDNNLHPYLLAEKEEPDLPDGTILSQTPAPGSSIKIHQAVYCVISRQPNSLTAPLFINKNLENIKKMAAEKNIPIKIYHIPGTAPQDCCIAQFPAPEQPLHRQPIIVYISKNSQKQLICPSLIGKPLESVTPFLDTHQVTYRLIHSNVPATDQKNDLCVLDQRPLPGSLMNPHEPISIYVK